jgi:hypothetical protein
MLTSNLIDMIHPESCARRGGRRKFDDLVQSAVGYQAKTTHQVSAAM